MYAIGEAAADINAARQELLANADRIYDMVDAGKEVSFEDRAAGRRTQVRAVWRAVSAVDEIFARSGGNAHADGQAAATVLARCARRPWRTPSTCRAPSTTPRR